MREEDVLVGAWHPGPAITAARSEASASFVGTAVVALARGTAARVIAETARVSFIFKG